MLSFDAEIIILPSWLKTAGQSLPSESFDNRPICVPVYVSQIRMVLSKDAETNFFPSGLNETEYTSQ